MSSPRYEREIRSLLDDLDHFLPDDPRSGKRPPPNSGGRRRSDPPITAAHATVPSWIAWLLRYPFFGAAALVIVARFVLLPLPDVGPTAALTCAALAIGLIVYMLWQSVHRVRYGTPFDRKWRGQRIDQPQSDVGQMLSRWWTRLHRRRP